MDRELALKRTKKLLKKNLFFFVFFFTFVLVFSTIYKTRRSIFRARIPAIANSRAPASAVRIASSHDEDGAEAAAARGETTSVGGRCCRRCC